MLHSDLIPLTICRIVDEAPGFRTFYFNEEPRITWAAGQFLTFVAELGGVTIRRSYSIISPPGTGSLAIGLRRIDNGVFSRYLFDKARVGDQLFCTGAAGLFQLPQEINEGDSYLFLAAGSGITPVRALIHECLLRRPGVRAILVYSNHDPSQAAYLPLLQQWRQEYGDRFSLHLLFSTDPQLRHARLNREGLLALLQKEDISPRNSWCFCCGPENYMRLCTYTLREAGIPADRLRREDFIPNRLPPPPLRPPDAEAHQVSLLWHGKKQVLQVQWPESILKAALREGLDIPYSCATGRCGSCAARCLEGSVWMSQDEVLTEADRAAGLVLTCTGFAVGGDATVSIG